MEENSKNTIPAATLSSGSRNPFMEMSRADLVFLPFLMHGPGFYSSLWHNGLSRLKCPPCYPHAISKTSGWESHGLTGHYQSHGTPEPLKLPPSTSLEYQYRGIGASMHPAKEPPRSHILSLCISILLFLTLSFFSSASLSAATSKTFFSLFTFHSFIRL